MFHLVIRAGLFLQAPQLTSACNSANTAHLNGHFLFCSCQVHRQWRGVLMYPDDSRCRHFSSILCLELLLVPPGAPSFVWTMHNVYNTQFAAWVSVDGPMNASHALFVNVSPPPGRFGTCNMTIRSCLISLVASVALK